MMLAIKSNVIACLFFIPAKVSLSLDKMKSKIYNLKEVKSRIRFYCAKEDRCQQQVMDKLLEYGVSIGVSEEILLELIQEKYVDEERYSRSFCSGKFKVKKWGRRKIIFELKKKRVSEVCIQKGLEEIVPIIYKYSTDDKYRRDFSLLADHFGIQEKKVSKGKYKSTGCVVAIMSALLISVTAPK